MKTLEMKTLADDEIPPFELKMADGTLFEWGKTIWYCIQEGRIAQFGHIMDFTPTKDKWEIVDEECQWWGGHRWALRNKLYHNSYPEDHFLFECLDMFSTEKAACEWRISVCNSCLSNRNREIEWYNGEIRRYQNRIQEIDEVKNK